MTAIKKKIQASLQKVVCQAFSGDFKAGGEAEVWGQTRVKRLEPCFQAAGEKRVPRLPRFQALHRSLLLPQV